MAGVNSCFAEVTENDILRMQDITIPNATRKATKLGMKVFKRYINNVLTHNLLTCPVSSVLIAKLRWCLSPWTTTVLPPSISKFHPSQLNFHWEKRLHSRKCECRYLSLKLLWFPTLEQQAHGTISELEISQTVLSISVSSKLQLPSRNYFKVLISLTAILSSQL